MEPRVRRPSFPGYGIRPPDEGELLSWERAVEHLERSRNYWVSTAGADGKPHAMPVWGIWSDDAVVFGTSATSRKGRNLARDPRVVVHLESGDDAVILEGEVEPFKLEDLHAAAFEAKYDWRPDLGEDDDTAWFALRPRRAFAWLERDYPRTATRYDW